MRVGRILVTAVLSTSHPLNCFHHPPTQYTFSVCSFLNLSLDSFVRMLRMRSHFYWIRFWKSRIRIQATQNYRIRPNPDPDHTKICLFNFEKKKFFKAFSHLILISIYTLYLRSFNNFFPKQ